MLETLCPARHRSPADLGARRRTWKPAVETLEDRTLLDAACPPVGPDFRVDPPLGGGTLDIGFASKPSTAMDADGNFVIAWEQVCGGEGAGTSVFAQLYNADGTPRGDAFLVAGVCDLAEQSQDGRSAFIPAVAMDEDGDFVVAWKESESEYGQGSNSGSDEIYARRFDADGNPIGDPFLVSTYQPPSGGQTFINGLAAAMDAEGDFMIAWTAQTFGQIGGSPAGPLSQVGPPDGSGNGLFVSLFDADGNEVTGEQQVASPTAGFSFQGPSVAMTKDGSSSVVTWVATKFEYYPEYVFVSEVLAQQFDADGDPTGGVISVTDGTVKKFIYTTSVGAAGNGDWAVTWVEDSKEVKVRQYHADGTPFAGPFVVATAPFDPDAYTSVGGASLAMEEDGDFSVIWMEYVGRPSVENHATIQGQQFNADGSLKGGPIQVSSEVYPSIGQTDVATTYDGRCFVATWDSFSYSEYSQEGHVYARLFCCEEPPPPPPPRDEDQPDDSPSESDDVELINFQGQFESRRIAFFFLREETPERPEQVGTLSTVLARPTRTDSFIQVESGTEATGTISGRVFEDETGDGSQQEGEVGLPGATVYLDLDENGVWDENEPMTVTNLNGDYSFTGLALRNYKVRVKEEEGLEISAPVDGVYDVTLNAVRNTVLGINYGFIETPASRRSPRSARTMRSRVRREIAPTFQPQLTEIEPARNGGVSAGPALPRESGPAETGPPPDPSEADAVSDSRLGVWFLLGGLVMPWLRSPLVRKSKLVHAVVSVAGRLTRLADREKVRPGRREPSA